MALPLRSLYLSLASPLRNAHTHEGRVGSIHHRHAYLPNMYAYTHVHTHVYLHACIGGVKCKGLQGFTECPADSSSLFGSVWGCVRRPGAT